MVEDLEGRETFEEEGIYLNYTAPMDYDSAVAMAQELACFERGGELKDDLVWSLGIYVEPHSIRIDEFTHVDREIAETIDADMLEIWLDQHGIEWIVVQRGDGSVEDRWNGHTELSDALRELTEMNYTKIKEDLGFEVLV